MTSQQRPWLQELNTTWRPEKCDLWSRRHLPNDHDRTSDNGKGRWPELTDISLLEADFRYGSLAPVWTSTADFLSTPINGHSRGTRACLKGAISGRTVQ